MKKEMIENYLNCPVCSFPVHSSRITITLKCPFCGQESKMSEVAKMSAVAMRGKATSVQERIQSPSPGFSFSSLLIGFGIGALFAPIILVSTREGARALGEMAEKKLKKL